MGQANARQLGGTPKEGDPPQWQRYGKGSPI
jgi:hypothetical protein